MHCAGRSFRCIEGDHYSADRYQPPPPQKKRGCSALVRKYQIRFHTATPPPEGVCRPAITSPCRVWNNHPRTLKQVRPASRTNENAAGRTARRHYAQVLLPYPETSCFESACNFSDMLSLKPCCRQFIIRRHTRSVSTGNS